MTIILDRAEAERLGGTHEILYGSFCKPGKPDASLVDVRAGAFDCTITDPPYSKRAQQMARAASKKSGELAKVHDHGFPPLSREDVRAYANAIALCTRRVAVVFCDAESWNLWADDLIEAGMVVVRQLIWVRHGAPQFTGDRPAQGHETMVLAFAGNAKIRWNSGGHDNVYGANGEHPVVRVEDGRIHPAQKPLSLMVELLEDFTDPGELVFDPFAGSGTTNLAAKNLGRRSLGVEGLAKHWTQARARLAAAIATGVDL